MATVYRVINQQGEFVGSPVARKERIVHLRDGEAVVAMDEPCPVYRVANGGYYARYYLAESEALARAGGAAVVTEENAEAYLKLQSHCHCEKCLWLNDDGYYNDALGIWQYECRHCGHFGDEYDLDEEDC